MLPQPRHLFRLREINLISCCYGLYQMMQELISFLWRREPDERVVADAAQLHECVADAHALEVGGLQLLLQQAGETALVGRRLAADQVLYLRRPKASEPTLLHYKMNCNLVT